MSTTSASPPPLAVAAVETFLEDPNWRTFASKRGWVISVSSPTTVIVTLQALEVSGIREKFIIRLDCEPCPTMPPHTRFVNPQTLEFDPSTDRPHLARLESPACRTHLNYSFNAPYQYRPQLVCSSMTYGYYISGHSPTPDQQWNPKRHSIGSTIEIIYRTLNSPKYYTGRFE